MDISDYNCEVVKFLAQPANIEYVFDIGERLEQVKNYLHLKFWRTVQKMLDDRITGPGRTGNWDLLLDNDQALLRGAWSGLSLRPCPRPADRYLYLGLHQQSGGTHLFSGIGWSKKIPQGYDPSSFAESIPSIVTLRANLAPGYKERPEPAWLRWKWYGSTEVPPLREKPACIRLATDDSLETMIVDDLMALFDSTSKLIEEANEKIKYAIEQGTLPSD